MKTCAYYQAPVDGNPIVAVFENPTWREYALERPVTGVAGANLCVIFRLLRLMFRMGKLKCTGVHETDLYKCRCAIVDASRKEYSNSKDRSDHDFKEDVKNNAEMLVKVIGKDKIVVCFGGRASKALKILGRSCSPRMQIDVCQLSNLAISKFAMLDLLRRRLHLSEAMIGFVPLIVIAEYICDRMLGGKFYTFREFYKDFRKGGNGDYPEKFNARLKSVMNVFEMQCCKVCCTGKCCTSNWKN